MKKETYLVEGFSIFGWFLSIAEYPLPAGIDCTNQVFEAFARLECQGMRRKSLGKFQTISAARYALLAFMNGKGV